MKRTKYVKVSEVKRLKLKKYPSAGPDPSIKGMRKAFWGEKAFVLRSGAYAYKVPANVFNSAFPQD